MTETRSPRGYPTTPLVHLWGWMFLAQGATFLASAAVLGRAHVLVACVAVSVAVALWQSMAQRDLPWVQTCAMALGIGVMTCFHALQPSTPLCCFGPCPDDPWTGAITALLAAAWCCVTLIVLHAGRHAERVYGRQAGHVSAEQGAAVFLAVPVIVAYPLTLLLWWLWHRTAPDTGGEKSTEETPAPHD